MASPLMILGILCGLGAAVGQAISYLYSRRYLAGGYRAGQMWLYSQLWLSLGTWPAVVFLWRPPQAGWGAMALPLGGAMTGYLTAQMCFYLTVRHVPASRVAPLLGIKVLFLALLATALGMEDPSWSQWAGVALAVVAAVAIQRSAEPVDLAGLAGVTATAVAFACSDVSIRGLITAIGGGGDDTGFGDILFAVGLVYTCGLVPALAMLPVVGWDRRAFAAALPYSLWWLASMVVLFAAIGWAGVVLAIILQALRGPFSIVFGYVVARGGHHHLEAPTDEKGLVRQLLAAALMVIATVIYANG